MDKLMQKLLKTTSISEQLLRYLLNGADFYFVFNVTKDCIVYSSVQPSDKVMILSEYQSLSSNTSIFSDIIAFVAKKYVVVESQAYIDFFDTKRLKIQYEEGNTEFNRAFEMSGDFKFSGTVEHHLLTFRDSETNDIYALVYALDKRYISETVKPDSITGGYTRNGFISIAKELRKNGDLSEYAVMYVNVRSFSTIVEILGIKGGEELLRNIYERVSTSELSPVISAREDLDRFLFLVKKSNLDLSKIPNLLNFHWNNNSQDLFVRCVCGILNIENTDMPIEKMIDLARLAKDYISNKDLNTYYIFNNFLFEDYSQKMLALSNLNNDTLSKEFVVFYQPIIDVKTEKIVCAEALIRKIQSDGSIIMPGEIIPFLEKNGYVTKLDKYAIEKVAEFLHSRYDNGLPFVPVSVNISQIDFMDIDTMNLLVERIKNGTLPKQSIGIEITESTYALQEKEQADFLDKLQKSGAEIVLDDFGIGYSSFGMFQSYFFKKVKLDMSFTRQLTKNPNASYVIGSIIQMCHSLNVCVVAEGVETAEEVGLLRKLDCDYIQGFYYSKPLCEAEYVDYLNSHM